MPTGKPFGKCYIPLDSLSCLQQQGNALARNKTHAKYCPTGCHRSSIHNPHQGHARCAWRCGWLLKASHWNVESTATILYSPPRHALASCSHVAISRQSAFPAKMYVHSGYVSVCIAGHVHFSCLSGVFESYKTHYCFRAGCSSGNRG